MIDLSGSVTLADGAGEDATNAAGLRPDCCERRHAGETAARVGRRIEVRVPAPLPGHPAEITFTPRNGDASNVTFTPRDLWSSAQPNRGMA